MLKLLLSAFTHPQNAPVKLRGRYQLIGLFVCVLFFLFVCLFVCFLHLHFITIWDSIDTTTPFSFLINTPFSFLMFVCFCLAFVCLFVCLFFTFAFHYNLGYAKTPFSFLINTPFSFLIKTSFSFLMLVCLFLFSFCLFVCLFFYIFVSLQSGIQLMRRHRLAS